VSFIHIADAAEATVATVEHGSRGIYNVVDDDPAPVAEWLPALAQTLAPRSPCACLVSSGGYAGEAGVVMMTELRGASTRWGCVLAALALNRRSCARSGGRQEGGAAPRSGGRGKSFWAQPLV
jgi:hypothetical protein